VLRPAGWRAVVAWARTAYQLSERRACRALGVARSSVQYRSGRPPQAPLRSRLRELAAVRVRYGYRRLQVLLRREGWRVNHKRVYRLYTDEGLTLKRRRPKRHRSATPRQGRSPAMQPNERWTMDFMHDTVGTGHPVRVLTILDAYTRECLGLVVRPRFTGADVAEILATLAAERHLPATIAVDNGTEFTSRALDHWAYGQRVQLDFSRPGKPGDNALIEAFNGRLRQECLSQHWFLSVADAQQTLDAWKADYNNVRPHSSLGQQPPAQFRVRVDRQPGPEQLLELRT
jgi:putative transposase